MEPLPMCSVLLCLWDLKVGSVSVGMGPVYAGADQVVERRITIAAGNGNRIGWVWSSHNSV
jgi:hypothetical protein